MGTEEKGKPKTWRTDHLLCLHHEIKCLFNIYFQKLHSVCFWKILRGAKALNKYSLKCSSANSMEGNAECMARKQQVAFK